MVSEALGTKMRNLMESSNIKGKEVAINREKPTEGNPQELLKALLNQKTEIAPIPLKVIQAKEK